MVSILWTIICALFLLEEKKPSWCISELFQEILTWKHHAKGTKRQREERSFSEHNVVNEMALIKFKFIFSSVRQIYIIARFVLYLQIYWREPWVKPADFTQHNMKFDSSKLISAFLECMILRQIQVFTEVVGRC